MKILHTTSIGLAVTAVIGVVATTAHAKPISIGALPQGSLSYSIASAVAKVIADKTDLKVRAIGIGGGNIYHPQVHQGKLDMSTSALPDSIFALTGKGPYEGRKHGNLRVLARLLEFQTGFMVRKDSKINSLADLKGKPFPSGFTSQKLVGVLVRAAFASEGMSPSDVVGVPVPNFVRGTDQFVAGKTVGSYLAPGSGIVRKANAKFRIRFISLKEKPGSLKILQSIAPGAYYTTVRPTKRMPYITEPVKMVGFDYLLQVGSKVSDAVAYKSAKALHQNKKSLIAAHGVFRGFKPKLIAKQGLGVDYHPGAIKYYKEAGLL
ncbi:MAG: TAXI family TRAP transporter solute-binding subunit [Pseudomonadota bacterium]|nr:TAXI family TRAP transporter solute-binding subunit [Pseudomonadota bacterium]